jgi:hypothetical protein
MSDETSKKMEKTGTLWNSFEESDGGWLDVSQLGTGISVTESCEFDVD